MNFSDAPEVAGYRVSQGPSAALPIGTVNPVRPFGFNECVDGQKSEASTYLTSDEEAEMDAHDSVVRKAVMKCHQALQRVMKAISKETGEKEKLETVIREAKKLAACAESLEEIAH